MSEKSKLFFNGKKKVIGLVHLRRFPATLPTRTTRKRS